MDAAITILAVVGKVIAVAFGVTFAMGVAEVATDLIGLSRQK